MAEKELIMERERKEETMPELDQGKLLGFRNLAKVTNAEDDLRDSSQLAFTKKGTETCN
jgi:hypothetical protein